jgi:hypothetical protein
MDLTEVSPLVGLTTKGFAVGHAPLKAASSKLVNHERARSDNQHVFILFAFYIFGFLAPTDIKFLKRVQRVMIIKWYMLSL